MCHNKTKFIDKVMDKCFWIFNLTLLINFVVLYMQINFPYSIIATTTANEIDFYLDLCSGLFTYGGTHVLNLFTCFIAVYNFAFASKLKNLNRKHALIIYNIIIIGISLFISTFNDNKAMFILLPVIIAIYFYSCKKTQSARIDRILKTIITIPLLIILLYQVSPEIKSFIDDNFLSLNTMINESVNIGNEANGSNERIAMIKYALDDVETYLFGKGFATVGLYTEGFEGFNHFGQADFGTLLNLGGIWFVIVLFYSYYRMIMKIVDKKNKNVIASVGIFCFLMFVFAYTQAFTAKDLCLALILIALAFKCEFNYSITTNRKHVNNLSAYRRCHC